MADLVPEDENTLQAIHRLMEEMEETRGKIKDMRDNIKDVLLQNEEYQTLQEEIKEMTTKRQQAKKLLDADRDFQQLNSELEELKFKLKDLQEIMSHHLVSHYDETRETQIKDHDGEVRQIILSAKVGRPEAITPAE
jgi:predicted  nucleic acid-binding Zn-ribbon protein